MPKATTLPAGFFDETVKEELYDLANANEGRIEPHLVVEAARHEGSAMHRLFTWDDSTAAARYRYLQAAALIRRVKITILRSDPVTKTVRVERVRAIESPASERRAGKGGSYVRAVEIAADREMRASMVSTVVAELSQIRRRYERLSELSGVWEAIAAAEPPED